MEASAIDEFRMVDRLVAALFLGMATQALLRADVTVLQPIGSHMVLQRDKPIPVRGTAARDEEVTVEFSGQTQSVRAGDKGA